MYVVSNYEKIIQMMNHLSAMRIKSIERCFDIIELLGQHPDGMRLSDIAANLGLNSSTVHHILTTLIHRKYISQFSDTKKYALGYAFLEISQQILDNTDLRKIARPYLEDLHKKSGEAVHLSVLQDDKVVYLDVIRSPKGLSLATHIGFSTEPHAAAGGKVLLAGLGDDALLKICGTSPFKLYTPNTCKNLTVLKQELARIRKRGYAIDDEEYYEGVRCVAAPVVVRGKTVASLSITGAVFTITLERIDAELARMAVEAADKISAAMQ